MAVKLQQKPRAASGSLEQLSKTLRGLSPAELETLALLADPEAQKIIKESFRQAKIGKVREIRS